MERHGGKDLMSDTWGTWHRVSAGRDDSWLPVADAARGTASSPAELAAQFGVDEQQVEEQLASLEVETCPGCGMWWDSFELANEEGYCPDCRTDEPKDEP
jgi:hypothetical protein